MPNSTSEIPPQFQEICGFTTAAYPSDGDRQPVWCRFPTQVNHADAIAALIEAASLDAGMEFSEFLKVVAASAPKEWEPPKNVGGRPLDFNWRAEYGKTAIALWAAAKFWLFVSQEVGRVTGKTIKPRLTMAAAVRHALKREHSKARNKGYVLDRSLSPGRINADAEKLKQAVRVKPARN